MAFNPRDYIFHFARIVIGIIFLYSGATKLMDLNGFALAIANYQLIPADFAPLAGTFLASLEVICGLALILNMYTVGSTLIIIALLVVFMAALSSALYRGLDINCGCFTTSSDATSDIQQTLLRDLALLIISFKVMNFYKKEF
ncbi:MAG: MauE/DoxX family redox-associated membrane protein [Desulfovibrio sp.]